jgi:ADP-dependent NAD(P)H-hydrate dehydratase / NAD(P)H-hydrate epimerase
MFEPLYTAEEMRAAEAGHDVRVLMERAGRAVAEEALRHFPEARTFGAICGGGANGGDARIALEALRAAGMEAQEGFEGDVLLDGLFGTGFHGEPRADAAELIAQMNAVEAPVVAVDLPSGVDADTGEVAGAAVRAAVTVALHGPKLGNVVGPGRFHGGELVVRDIGLAPQETSHALVTREILAEVPRKQPGDTKYRASVLVVGGAPGLTGAACLAVEAAFRADAGYVAVAAPAESLPVLETRLLEAVKRPLGDVFDALEKADALAIGPGLGRDDDRRELVRRLLVETELPAVVDADALFELAAFQRQAPTVLTPHAGELAGLLGVDSAWVDAHRLQAVRQAVDTFGCVCLLKGADTIVAAPESDDTDGRVLVCGLGPPSLATAGTGDVLTGTIAAFLAKGMDARLAAAAGATACAEAARLGPEHGLVASDVIEALPDALDAAF